MRERLKYIKTNKISLKLLLSYFAIILAPAIAIIIIYGSMQKALLGVQTERAKNLSQSTAVAFDKEVEMIINIGSYVSTDSDLQDYTRKIVGKSMVQKFFGAYVMANDCPNYSLINDFVKDVYVLYEESEYIICIPQVIPNNRVGMATLDLFRTSDEYQTTIAHIDSLGKRELFCEQWEDGSTSCYVKKQFNFGTQKGQRGYVVIELEKKKIESMLKNMLGTEIGSTMLVDEEGKIMYAYERMNKVNQKAEDNTDWQTYMSANGWDAENMLIMKTMSAYNGWSFITLIPKEELLGQIYRIQLPILILCMVSVFIGVGMCLFYWNKSRQVVRQYVHFSETYPNKEVIQAKTESIWKGISGVFSHVENLQDMVEKQKQWAQDGILRNLLFGTYDSQKELEKELKNAGLEPPLRMPCYVVMIEVDNPMQQKIAPMMDAFEKVLYKCLEQELPYQWQIVNMGTWKYIIFIQTENQELDTEQLKILFEQITYEIYTKLTVTIYTGISNPAYEMIDISEEYEHACRICEYAQYYKVRVPVLLDELPHHQHVVFTIELEMQLERAIKAGSEEQLDKLMKQVMENYLIVSVGSRPIHQHLEVLRCVLMRCVSNENPDLMKPFVERVQTIKTASEMKQIIFELCRYFNKKKTETETDEETQLKQKLESIIEKGYFNPDFNLVMLADEVQIQEKKLYRDFKKMFGISFSSYLEMLRIQSAQELLKQGSAVQDVAEKVGYSSDYSFRRAFKRVVGVTPTDYQKMQ